jgi:hypothetical protein
VWTSYLAVTSVEKKKKLKDRDEEPEKEVKTCKDKTVSSYVP